MRRAALVVGAVVVAAAVVLFALRDRTDRAPPAPPPTPVASACRVRLEGSAPSLRAAIRSPPPPSRLALRADLPLAEVARLIGERVPVQLASATGRSIGVAGELSYTVARGPLDLALEDDRLWVRVPVAAQVEVCKPLGPICPVYGNCSPKLAVGFGVPLLLDAMTQGTETSLQIAEGCSIVGFDVSGRLTSQASGQIASVKRRVDAALPTPDHIDQLPPLPAGLPVDAGCLVVHPQRVVQGPPTVDGDTLHLAFDAEVRLEHTPSCPDGRLAIPPVERGPVTEGRLVLDAGLVLPTEKLQDALTVPGVTAQRPLPTRDALVVRLDFEGDVCGSAWLAVTPTVTEAIRYEPRWLGTPPPASEALLAAVRALRQPLPEAAPSLLAALNGIDAGLADLEARRPEDIPLQASIEGNPAKLTVAIEPDGLRLRAERAPTVRVTVR